jgi:hypothetical protein
MTIRVGVLPTVARSFETGITIEILAKKLSKKSVFLPSTFSILPDRFWY